MRPKNLFVSPNIEGMGKFEGMEKVVVSGDTINDDKEADHVEGQDEEIVKGCREFDDSACITGAIAGPSNKAGGDCDETCLEAHLQQEAADLDREKLRTQANSTLIDPPSDINAKEQTKAYQDRLMKQDEMLTRCPLKRLRRVYGN